MTAPMNETTERHVAWRPIETAPKDGTYLVANDSGHVAPWINGVIHNNVGTPWDWHYGERAVAWQPLPTYTPAASKEPK